MPTGSPVALESTGSCGWLVQAIEAAGFGSGVGGKKAHLCSRPIGSHSQCFVS